MADQRFFDAFLTPASSLVLGRRLKPMCIKHRIFLEGIGSPFVREDAQLTIPDLIIALKVCGDELIDRPTLRDKWLGLRLALSDDLFRRGCRAMVQHLDTPKAFPRFWERDEKKSGGASSIPWQLNIIATLVKGGVSYEDALLMPEARAVWLASVFSIHQGAKLEILTTDDEDLIDQLAKERDSQNGK